jgi:hypothetical protein
MHLYISCEEFLKALENIEVRSLNLRMELWLDVSIQIPGSPLERQDI